jgi:4-hydroxy-tetrahydrodipicolinate reductase
MSDMRLVVAGASGRMGRVLSRLIATTPGLTLAGAIEQASSPFVGQDSGLLAGLSPLGLPVTADVDAALVNADGLVDFTIPAASVQFAALAAKHGKVLICGTTGFTVEQDAQIQAAAKSAVIVKSGNFSLGVNLLASLVRKAAAALDADFDIEIVEMHHNKKIDAPSGTALMLGVAAAEGRGIDLASASERGRDGHTGARAHGAIGFASLRGGTVVGEHSAVFAGPCERLVLGHIAEDRALFANGALKAALWARSHPPGLYSMADVLGLT